MGKPHQLLQQSQLSGLGTTSFTMDFKLQYHGVRIHNCSIRLPRINKLHSKNPCIVSRERHLSAVAVLLGCCFGAPTVSRNSASPCQKWGELSKGSFFSQHRFVGNTSPESWKVYWVPLRMLLTWDVRKRCRGTDWRGCGGLRPSKFIWVRKMFQ